VGVHKSLIFKIFQNLHCLLGEFENGSNVVLIQYPANMVCGFFFMYGRMEKVLLPVSCDGCWSSLSYWCVC